MKAEREVYVVDDSHIIVSMITQSINQVDGLKATAFDSGEKMVIAAEVIQPAVVILDFFLDIEIKGGMNGGDVARYLRKNLPKTKIILISGTSSKKALAEIQALDVDAHLHKDEDDILDLISAKVLELLG